MVLLALGVHYRKLDIPGAERLTGRGIYYGAALVEAAVCKDEDVYVVGGANSAGQAALHFASYARKVTMLVRGPGLSATMSKYLIDEIARTSNIVLEAFTQVVEAFGEERLEALRLKGPDGEYIACLPRRFSCLSARLRDRVAAGQRSARREGVSAGRAGFAQRRQTAGRMAGAARAVSAGDQRAGGVCGRRCAARVGQARGLGGGRGVDRGAVCAPVSGWVLGESRKRGNERRQEIMVIESVPLTEVAAELSATLPFADDRPTRLAWIEWIA